MLIWSGPGGHGRRDRRRARRRSSARLPPSTSRRRRTAARSSRRGTRAGEGEPSRPEKIGVLLVSGDDAAADPTVRALAEQADAVIAITMFADPARGWADLVLPATSYLERDGTMVNLEGRPQRLRRAVIPPAPDELAWIAKLAERFEVEIDPHARAVSADEHAALPPRAEPSDAGASPAAAAGTDRAGRPAPARCATAALLRPGGRARRGAPVPAAGARDRALRPRRRDARDLRRATRSSSARTAPRSGCARGSTGSSSTAPSAPPRSTCASCSSAVEVSKQRMTASRGGSA